MPDGQILGRAGFWKASVIAVSRLFITVFMSTVFLLAGGWVGPLPATTATELKHPRGPFKLSVSP